MEINKTVKITNCRQFECLVGLMEKNTDIAKRFFTFGSSKQDFNAAWEGFAIQLNSLGPPIREGTGWQKVWNDLKNKIKKKLGHNKKEMSATGGGSNKLFAFSVLEESVISLLSLEKITPTSNQSFGLVQNKPASSTLAASNHHHTVNESTIELNTANDQLITLEETINERGPEIYEQPATNRRKRPVSFNLQEERKRLLEEQTNHIKMQTQFMDEQNNKMDERNKYIKEHVRYTRKLFEVKEQKFNMWKQLQLEKGKHCQENMEYKLKVLDYKERKLALKENKKIIFKAFEPKIMTCDLQNT